jgi:hypothetical protein
MATCEYRGSTDRAAAFRRAVRTELHRLQALLGDHWGRRATPLPLLCPRGAGPQAPAITRMALARMLSTW